MPWSALAVPARAPLAGATALIPIGETQQRKIAWPQRRAGVKAHLSQAPRRRHQAARFVRKKQETERALSPLEAALYAPTANSRVAAGTASRGYDFFFFFFLPRSLSLWLTHLRGPAIRVAALVPCPVFRWNRGLLRDWKARRPLVESMLKGMLSGDQRPLNDAGLKFACIPA